VLNQDFKEFIESLNNHEVRYLVIGGYAVALHGYPRYTKDIDIWVEMSSENASKIMKALEEFGFGSLGINESDFTLPEHILQLGYPPNQIDILTTLHGVTFSSCYEVRKVEEIDGISVNFINLDDLKKNKKATGRNQDLADLENLE
jgi:predicted nucleotidyltransferase